MSNLIAALVGSDHFDRCVQRGWEVKKTQKVHFHGSQETWCGDTLCDLAPYRYGDVAYFQPRCLPGKSSADEVRLDQLEKIVHMLENRVSRLEEAISQSQGA
jgi:hypothetical protein